MYSELHHIFFSTMSNSDKLFHIKDDKEDYTNFDILIMKPALKFQTECHRSISSNSSESHSREHKDKNNDQLVKEGEDREEEASTSREKKIKVEEEEEEEEEEDGFRTPTSLDHRIPVFKQCPPAPRKPKPSLKRKAPCSSCRHLLDLSEELELLFPIQHKPLSRSHQATKKVRREVPN